MSETLQQEYIRLTTELVELTRRRNEVGQKLADQRARDDARAARVQEINALKAMLAIGDHEDWAGAEKIAGVGGSKLLQSCEVVLRRLRYSNPAADIPVRIGPRTLKKWAEWRPHVAEQLKKLSNER